MTRMPPFPVVLGFIGLTGSRVVETLRLSNGVLFSMPITLDVSDIEVRRFNIVPGTRLTLRDFRDENPVAILTGILLSSSHLMRLSNGLLIKSRGCMATQQGERRAESVRNA